MNTIYILVAFSLIFLTLPVSGCAQEMSINKDGKTYVRFDKALSQSGDYQDAYLRIKEHMEKQGKDIKDYFVVNYEEVGVLTVIIEHRLDLLEKKQWKDLGTSRGSMACEYDLKSKKLMKCLVSS